MVRDAREDHYKAVSKMGLWKNPIRCPGWGWGVGVEGGDKPVLEMFAQPRADDVGRGG